VVRKQLTDLAVRAIRSKAKYFEIVDGTSGLRLAVFPSGAKSWIRRYRRPDFWFRLNESMDAIDAAPE
jgi:hypothetical protein